MGEQAIHLHEDPALERQAHGRLGGFLSRLVENAPVSCEFLLPNGEIIRHGTGPPQFQVVFRNPRLLNKILDEYTFCRDYVQGEIDIEGDLVPLLDLRFHLPDRFHLSRLRFWVSTLLSNPVRTNRKLIESHYGRGNELYLDFLDSRYRLYSHGLYANDATSLEEAAEEKLRSCFESLQLRPGMRVLDIGAGWGSFIDYAGSRGVKVTGLVLAENQQEFIQNLIRKKHLPGEVRLQDFLSFSPRDRYDAIVNFGVIEHIPQYRQFFRQVWDCLSPGGGFYLDASATREKFDKSDFSAQFIWPGAHTFMCLQSVIRELLFHGLDLLRVENESHDYELTMKHWAENLEAHRDSIVSRVGEACYRAFRLFLWGGHHAFFRDQLQAYSLLARRSEHPGPRHGPLKRLVTAFQEAG